ncbi:MAG: peptide chain release factor N(5)-glutamine methyltransferase [Myxococcota bacterium]|nr:peptide chain release factor N(5)-glutamine methyltransferase [Myxococcota bacterium]
MSTTPQTTGAVGGSPTHKTWTVLGLLRWTTDYFAAKQIETARLDAECLLAHALGVDRLRLYLEFDKPVTEGERADFRELVRRRGADRVPVAYLTGVREFWSLPIRVSPDVLVPRPETEILVEAGLGLLPDVEGPVRVLEIGTGSGAVSLALATERPGAEITATDVSPASLEIARSNAETLGVAERIHFAEGDCYVPVAGQRFDLIVSNPPYVADAGGVALPPELAHEPPTALFGGADGLAVLEPLVRQAAGHLEAGGGLALECDPGQADRVAGWCTEAGFHSVTKQRDLAGRERVVVARGGG